MALKTSLVITGDSKVAVEELRRLEGALDAAARRAELANRANRKLSESSNDNAKEANRQAFAIRNVGQQVGDFGLQAASGAGIARAFSQQIGQLGFAMSEMGGKAGKVGAFLTGPWGIALTIATAVAAPFVEQLFEGGEGADALADRLADAAKSADAFGNAQSLVGKIIELSTGKLTKQNVALIENIRLQAEANILAGEEAKVAARKQIGTVGQPSIASRLAASAPNLLRRGLQSGNVLTAIGGALTSGDIGREQAAVEKPGAALRALADRVLAGTAGDNRNIRLSVQALEKAGKLNNLSKREILTVTSQLQSLALAEDQRAAGQASRETIDAVVAGKGLAGVAPGLRKTGASRTPRAGPKGPSAASLASAGLGIGDQIADIEAQYSSVPTAIKKANDQLRELDKIKASIDAKPLLPGADALKGRIEALGSTINESINKPFEDYLEQQRQSAEIDKLLLQGRNDEAAALQTVIGLQEKQGTLNEAQLAQVLALTKERRVQSVLLRDQQALIQGNVQAVQSFRGALEQTIADSLRGRFSLSAILTSLGNSAINLVSQRLVEQVFGSTLRSLEEQARGGGNTVEAAATGFSTSLTSASKAVESFANTALSVSARMAGARVASNDNAAPVAGADGMFGIDYSKFDEPAIEVKGARQRGLVGQGVAEQLINIVDSTLGAIGGKLPGVLIQGLKGTLGKLEKSLPQALSGAFTGATASRIILGDKGTVGTIGSAIGGAVGQKLGSKFLESGLTSIAKGLGQFAGPIGSIAGGLIGGLLGGLFAKAKFGTASVSNKGDGPVVGGNDAKAKSTASSLGDAVSSGIQQIADQLGAQVGNFNVSIGTFKDNFRVSTTGFTGSLDSKKAKGQGLVDFGKDGQDKAIAFAIADAISDGAILGITPKVAAALKSSPDINKALAEAVKTADLELALGGVGAQLAKEFKTFERTAADRLRIAKAYGFDIVKVEELNAKQRLALNEKLLKDQVGSIQNLIDELTTGSLFEGSAVDQRAALLSKIEAARADANAGVEGAGDKLAGLLEKLNSVSRDAFGTTGGFAADRQLILDVSRDVIARYNQRVNDAQKGSDPALQTTNALLDEQTNQLAKIGADIRDSAAYLRAIANAPTPISFTSLRSAASY